jgi:hypothetical protein
MLRARWLSLVHRGDPLAVLGLTLSRPLADQCIVERLEPLARLDHVRGDVGVEAFPAPLGNDGGEVDKGVLKPSESVRIVHEAPIGGQPAAPPILKSKTFAILESVWARVMTFYSDNEDMTDLMASLRSQLRAAYEPIPGFRGALVLGETGGRSHVIALTLWDDEETLQATRVTADEFADQIAVATGTSVARHVYNVLGSLGVAGDSTE